MSSNDQHNHHIPSEMRISKVWDAAIEDTVIKAVTGAGIAGLASIVLFRKLKYFPIFLVWNSNLAIFFGISIGGRSSRLAFTAFGVGFGSGFSYKTAALNFEKEKSQA